MSNDFDELMVFTPETFINLKSDEIYDLVKIYYYFKLTQTLTGTAPALTHFMLSIGALLVKICAKTPPVHLKQLSDNSGQLRDFIEHEITRVKDAIEEYGTDVDKEEYL